MDTAVEKFQGGVVTFQQQLEALTKTVNAERATLKANAEELQQERQAFEEEKQRVSQVSHYPCTRQRTAINAL